MAFSLGTTPSFPTASSSSAPTFGFGVGNTATTTKGWYRLNLFPNFLWNGMSADEFALNIYQFCWIHVSHLVACT